MLRIHQHSPQHIPVPQLHAQGPGGLYIIRIRLTEDSDQIKQDTQSAQPSSAYVKNAHDDFSFVKLMRTNHSKEQAQKQGDPFILCTPIATVSVIGVIRVVVCVVDDYVWLLV